MERSLLELEQRLMPATGEEILVMLTALAEYYGIEKQEGLSTRLTMMVQDLKGFSVAHIEHAITEHRQTSNWFPKSPELREPLLTRQNYAVVMRRRARILLGMEAASTWENDMVERLRSQEERRRAEENIPDIQDRIAKLPPQLAKSVQGLIGAAQESERRRSA